MSYSDIQYCASFYFIIESPFGIFNWTLNFWISSSRIFSSSHWSLPLHFISAHRKIFFIFQLRKWAFSAFLSEFQIKCKVERKFYSFNFILKVSFVFFQCISTLVTMVDVQWICFFFFLLRCFKRTFFCKILLDFWLRYMRIECWT